MGDRGGVLGFVLAAHHPQQLISGQHQFADEIHQPVDDVDLHADREVGDAFLSRLAVSAGIEPASGTPANTGVERNLGIPAGASSWGRAAGLPSPRPGWCPVGGGEQMRRIDNHLCDGYT